MKILVTGSDGFVGRHLTAFLRSNGHNVIGVDVNRKNRETIKLDLLNFELLETTLLQLNPVMVVHLAAISHVNQNANAEIYQVNIQGMINLMNACSVLPKIPRFMLISSALAYGRVPMDKQPIDESTPLNPGNHYAASKASCEMILKAFSEECGMEYVIVRPFNHTGPGHAESFVVPKIIRLFKDGQKSVHLGNVNVVRDFLDVRDVVNAYSMIIDSFPHGKIYNIASGKGITISQVVQKLSRISGRQLEIIQDTDLIRKNEIESLVGNSERLRNELAWAPRYELDDTLKLMIS